MAYTSNLIEVISPTSATSPTSSWPCTPPHRSSDGWSVVSSRKSSSRGAPRLSLSPVVKHSPRSSTKSQTEYPAKASLRSAGRTHGGTQGATKKQRTVDVDRIIDWRSPSSTTAYDTPQKSTNPSPIVFLPPSLLSSEVGDHPTVGPRKRHADRKRRQRAKKALFAPISSPRLSPSAQTFVPSTPTTKTKISTSSPSKSPTKINSPVISPEGGKLRDLCQYLFCQAYGLRAVRRRPHDDVIRDAMNLTGCSIRAIQEVLYSHSYEEELLHLRQMIPVFPMKVRARGRTEYLAQFLLDNNNPLFTYDGTLEVQDTTDLHNTKLSSDFQAAESEATTTLRPHVMFSGCFITRLLSCPLAL